MAADRKIVMTDPRKTDSLYEEAIKTLRTNLQFAGRSIQVILVTSCYPNEGKSDIAFQLAREIVNMGKRVVYLDADMRKSMLVSRYQVKQKGITGLSHYLCGQADPKYLCYETNYPNVEIVFAGRSVPNPSELLEDEAMGNLMQSLRMNHDYVIVDAPPILSVSDPLILAKCCDGALLVIESKKVSYKVLQRAKKQLETTGCKLLGAALNKVDLKQDTYYSKYYGHYGYYKGYGNG